MHYKDKDNPDSGNTDDDPSLSNKVNLDGSSANDNPGSRDLNEPIGEVMNTTLDKVSFGTPLMDDPGSDVSMDNKDKDNPGGGSTDADPSLSNKVNLDGSSANDNPGSRDFNTLHQLASSNTKASRFSLIFSVTKAPLNEPTIEVMNTTLDTVSSGTLLMDDPGGFWPNGEGCAIYDYDYDVYHGG